MRQKRLKETGMDGGSPVLSRAQPPVRAARKSEWLRSALEHLHGPEAPVRNEVVVLATGIDQYLQEVFHHLARPGRGDTVSAEDFKALCLVLGLRTDAEQRTPVDHGDEEEEEEEFGWICCGLPGELTFKDFHSRLCAFFRVRTAGGDQLDNSVKRLNFSVETELVEREIRLRCPRVRRRKCVSFDLSVNQSRVLSKATKKKVHTEDFDPAGAEAAALRELVEDLRASLQASDARCLSLEVALRRPSGNTPNPALTPTLNQDPGRCSQPSADERLGGKWTDRAKRGTMAAARRRGEAGDPVLRELRLIRESRDGQLDEAIRFSRRLEEELSRACQEVRRRAGVESALRKENAAIRRRAEEAREAVKQGLQRVRLIQEQAQSVPELQNTISHLENELQHYRTQCTCMTDTTARGYYPITTEDTCSRMGEGGGLRRAVEGRAASDEEEEDEEERGMKGKLETKTEDGGQCCLLEMKKFINRPHTCGQGCQNPVMRSLLSQNTMDHQEPRSSPHDEAWGHGGKGHAQPGEGPADGEDSGLGAHLEEVEQVCLLEEKVSDALALLLTLRRKNLSGRTVDEVCSRGRRGPAHMIQVADSLRAQLQLSTNEIVRGEAGGLGANEEGGVGGAQFGMQMKQSSSCQSNSRSTNTLVISC